MEEQKKGLTGLMAKAQPIKNSKSKNKKEDSLVEKKEYHNIYLLKTDIKLLNKITNLKKVEEEKYTKADTIHDALELLAKTRGVTL